MAHWTRVGSSRVSEGMETDENQPNRNYPRAKDIAKAFGISPKTIWGWAQRGLVPRYRIGHSTFFRWEDVDVILARNRYVGRVRSPVAKL